MHLVGYQKRLDVNAQAAGISNFSSDVSIQKSEEGKIIFSDKKKLVFGIELFELEYNTTNKRFRLKLTEEVFKVRRAGEQEEEIRTRKVLKPAFVGDPKEGDIFFEIADSYQKDFCLFSYTLASYIRVQLKWHHNR